MQTPDQPGSGVWREGCTPGFMDRQAQRGDARSAREVRSELARRAAQAERDLEAALQQLTEQTAPDVADETATDGAPRERVLKRRAAAAQRDLDLTVAEMVRRIERVQAPLERVRDNAAKVGVIAGGGLVLLLAARVIRTLRRSRRTIHPRGTRIPKVLVVLRVVEAFVVLGSAAYAASPKARAALEPWQRRARLAYRRLVVVLSRLFARALQAVDGTAARRKLIAAPLRPPRPREPIAGSTVPPRIGHIRAPRFMTTVHR